MTQNILQKLVATNFRNIDFMSIDFQKKYNIFCGTNGQGKTNILQAINVILTTNPLDTHKNIHLIKNGQEKATLSANIASTMPFNLSLNIFPKGKLAYVNNQKITKKSNWPKNFSIVSFMPHELSMIFGSASLRRKALDEAAISFFDDHKFNLLSYEKYLRSRNFCLKEANKNLQLIASYQTLLVNIGAKIIFNRVKILNNINNFFEQALLAIMGKKINSKITYESFCTQNDSNLSNIENLLLEKALTVQKEELLRKQTLFGPHLDDINFIVDGLDAKHSSSRGECRALVLAFKIAIMKSLFTFVSKPLIILLDDIISELDTNRKKSLLNTIDKIDAQVFFTTVEKDIFAQNMLKSDVFYIENGRVKDKEEIY